MAGTYSVGETKTRPGVYHRRYSVGGGELAGALNGVGMGIIRANWGPLNKAVAFDPSTNVNAVFGSGNTEDLITEMFSGGISSGYFVRCGTGGTAPTITLKDDAKADVVTITGAYVGDRAFTVSIRDSLTGDDRECIIYEGTTEFLKVTFAADKKEPAGLAAAINAATKDFHRQGNRRRLRRYGYRYPVGHDQGHPAHHERRKLQRVPGRLRRCARQCYLCGH